MPLIPQAIAEAVARDGLSRQAVATDDGSLHVLYLDGAAVRSMFAYDWPPPLPSDPTEAEIAVAIAAREAADRQKEQDAAALRQRIRTAAQSAVGQSIDTLTAAQVRALLAVLLYRTGMLDKNGIVQPIDALLARQAVRSG